MALASSPRNTQLSQLDLVFFHIFKLLFDSDTETQDIEESERHSESIHNFDAFNHMIFRQVVLRTITLLCDFMSWFCAGKSQTSGRKNRLKWRGAELPF